MKLVLLLSLLLSVFLQESLGLTQANVTAMQSAIQAAFGLTNSYGQPCNPCTSGSNIGAMVRLIFHDAAGGGGPNGVGGMNGCIDFNATESTGLQSVVATYDTIYPQFSSLISKADFWLLGANLAIQYASTPATHQASPPGFTQSPGTLYLPMRYGRVDAASCVGEDGAYLPNAGFNWTQMFALFGTRLGMTVQQTIAIMGAHSLGKTTYQDSGFEGGWTVVQASFSNFYYTTLGNVLWNNSNASNIWVDKNTGAIMLTVDVEGLYSPSSGCPVFGNFDAHNCNKNTAPSSGGNPYASVVYYASNISAFYANFSTAWQILSEFQYTNLYDPFAATTTTAAGTTTSSASTSSSSSSTSTSSSSSSTSTTSSSSSTTTAPSPTPTAQPSQSSSSGTDNSPNLLFFSFLLVPFLMLYRTI